jgi:hypothetical protein
VVVFNQDCDLRYTWINSPVLAWAEQEFMGRTDRDIVGGPEAEELMAIKGAVLDSGVRRRVETVVTFNSERHYYDLTVEPDAGQHWDDSGGHVLRHRYHTHETGSSRTTSLD